MTTGFRRRHDGGVEATFSADELALLRQVAAEMLELFGEPGQPGQPGQQSGRDPLERMVGLSGTGATEAPDDPVLARLFPDAYAGDSGASAEFRRYTQEELWDDKRAAAARVASDVSGEMSGDASGGPALRASGKYGHLVLDGDGARVWLRALNDARLALGTRLGVSEEAHEEFEAMDPDDPRYPGYAAYDWLSFLLDTLVRALG